MKKLERVKIATENDLMEVVQLYKTICDHQPQDQYGADWTWGDYPSVASLKKLIKTSLVMIGYCDGRVVAGGVVTTGDEYSQVDWKIQADNNQIGVLHLFGVHPDYRRTGISSAMLQSILNQAKQDGKTVMHLDVLAKNLPSERLYVKNGFRVVKELTIHYDDIGDQAAKVLEYRL